MASPAIDQEKTGFGNAASRNVTFTSTPTVGDLIVVICWFGTFGLGTTLVSDNQGNTYTIRANGDSTNGNTIRQTQIYTATAATSSGTFTVTVNPGTTTDIDVAIYEVSGGSTLATASLGDNAARTTHTINLADTTEDALIFGSFIMGNSGITLTPAAGWTDLSYAWTTSRFKGMKRSTTGAGAYDPEGTTSTSQYSNGAALAIMAAATASGSKTNKFSLMGVG